MSTVTAPTIISRRLRRAIAAVRAAATLAAIVTLAVTSAACTEEPTKFDYLRIQIDGQPTLSISKAGVLVRGIVVFFHGQDEDEFALTVGEGRKSMTRTLVGAGFAVVASRAGGNAFTSAATVDNYRELASTAREHYRIENIYFLAESTGAVAAANLLAAGYSPVRGMAAITPVLNVDSMIGRPTPLTSHEPPAIAQVADPIDLPATSLAGSNMRFYVAGADPVAKAATNVAAFEQKFRPSASISVVDCSGGHADESCYQPDDVAKWFTSLDKRSTS